MRYLIQLLVPALIFAGVVYLLTRRHRQDSAQRRDDGQATGSETGAFLAILVVSAAVALGAAYMMQSMWE